MRISKTIRLIWTFYKSFFLLSLLLTIFSLVLFWEYGLSIFSELFWLKIVTLAITFYFINSQKNKEYYYYQNLGLSKNLIWTTSLIFDFFLFILLIILIYNLR
jgi:hypothetical protein